VYIEFAGRQVAVSSDTAAVLSWCATRFRFMLARQRVNPIVHLRVERRAGRYLLLLWPDVRIAEGPLSHTLQCLRHEVVLHLMRARAELLWLHSAAAASRGSAVVICGPRGSGKSTIVMNLCLAGWSYLSDDVLPVERSLGTAVPFPLTPTVRESVRCNVSLNSVLHLPKVVVAPAPELLSPVPVHIGAIVLPAYQPGCHTELLPCSPGAAALELIQACLNFYSHRETAVSYICGLVKRVPVFRLPYSSGGAAGEVLCQMCSRSLTD
jgi:hypothetical protein